MERMHETAIEAALALEIRSLTLYRALSSNTTNPTNRRTFELLAQTAAEHLELFCNLFQGSDHELIALLGANTIYLDPHYNVLLNAGSFTTANDAQYSRFSSCSDQTEHKENDHE